MGADADAIWGHCAGYPGHEDAGEWAAWFGAHQLDSSLFFAAYGADMTDHAVRARDRWSPGQVVDVDEEMMRLTLAIASSTLFGQDVETDADQVREDAATILGQFLRFAIPFFGVIQKLPLPSNRRFARAVARLDALVYRLIAKRRREGRDAGDLLSMPLRLQDEEAVSYQRVPTKIDQLGETGLATTSAALSSAIERRFR